MKKRKLSKKPWVKPTIRSLKFNQTLGGTYPSTVESTESSS